MKKSREDAGSPEGKEELIKRFTPRSKTPLTVTRAFISGGALCALGEAFRQWLTLSGVSEEDSFLYTSLTVIALAAVLTAVGIFDRLVRWCGAGLLVPISGFSNSIVSSAMDARSEGKIVGVGSALFTVSGPVIVWGLGFGALYGIAYYISGLFL